MYAVVGEQHVRDGFGLDFSDASAFLDAGPVVGVGHVHRHVSDFVRESCDCGGVVELGGHDHTAIHVIGEAPDSRF